MGKIKLAFFDAKDFDKDSTETLTRIMNELTDIRKRKLTE